MWVALIVLIVMSLAGLAMLRQMGTGISVAGNIAFKQNATSTADGGTEAARFFYTTVMTPLQRETDNAANAAAGYYATWNGTWGPTVDPTQFDWRPGVGSGTAAIGSGAADIAMGNTSQYIIQRLCQNTGSVQASTQVCSDLEDDTMRAKGSFDYTSSPIPPSFKPYFRVTTRVVGPRNTVSFTQVILN
jgi:type IV pilus assembly protein PilX